MKIITDELAQQAENAVACGLEAMDTAGTADNANGRFVARTLSLFRTEVGGQANLQASFGTLFGTTEADRAVEYADLIIAAADAIDDHLRDVRQEVWCMEAKHIEHATASLEIIKDIARKHLAEPIQFDT